MITRREIYNEMHAILHGMKTQAREDGDGVRTDKCRKLEVRLNKLMWSDEYPDTNVDKERW